jgi:hypothetical protein
MHSLGPVFENLWIGGPRGPAQKDAPASGADYYMLELLSIGRVVSNQLDRVCFTPQKCAQLSPGSYIQSVLTYLDYS